MNRKLDEFLGSNDPPATKEENQKVKKKQRLRATNLDEFLPEDHINFFKNLRIGSKKIARKKIEEL
ncbi:hypothetical protein PFDSM3638_05745 [Pyrococcus furiosus DSM 3638]|uniref:Uncharacterized protein n=3 Tax=Pyrococcus furiosus TaxID=2261 RepID=Q8U1Q9_PYRFU|nr:PCNA-inhibitor [Pyrococcus furiosus]AAL81270.1 hypothetical protein PF1146 [Pyrococcus furiosus DSM 3638]AFN03938.1 hypothetical protein PFC_04955 [Pyrococcus furiosus COM1]QEK78801.1 hypothetical protein PFDSM3638_05745 [Pyrococcus furiosus DSM 3638]